MIRIVLCAILLAATAAGAEIEKRDAAGSSDWRTNNGLRTRAERPQPSGVAVALELEAPDNFSPDSVRVLERKSGRSLPRKVEWRRPLARVSWLSTGVAAYDVYFDVEGQGETERPAEPAMIGAGERVTYGRPGVRAKLAVGLHPHPAPLDFNGDGLMDMVVSCPDHPYNGIYLFRNIGTAAEPLYDRAEWLGPGKRDLLSADFNGDGRLDLVTRGGYYSDFLANRLSRWVDVELPREHHVGRDDLWNPVDWDGDGKIDLLTGVSDWREYGWDNAFNKSGEWTNGPVHGFIYFHRNIGSNERPKYAPPEPLQAGGKTLELRGSPTPNPVDWFGRGRLDLIGGDFIDTVTIFENVAAQGRPNLAAGKLIEAAGKPIQMHLCMIQPRVVDWRGDGRPSLLVAEEDGYIAFFENQSPKGQPAKLAAPKFLQQVDPYLKSGVLSRPEAIDWNGDGKLDLLAGNSAGYVQYFENVGATTAPVFEDRGYLEAGGETIRIMAGLNLSIQGPIEQKWGYTVINAADWDLDGKPDLMLNSIVGEVLWYRNVGTAKAPRLSAGQPVDVEWPSAPPKPAWNWWQPKGKQLVTQWRTTPKIVDWNADGLPDLVSLDHEGYLALFARRRDGSNLRLKAPVRIFQDENGKPLRLNDGEAGKSGRRKIDLADWDGDGDLDLIVDTDNAAWYENTGSQQKPVMAFRGNLVSRDVRGHSPAADVADWTGDGKLDLLIGAEDGFFYFFERNFIDENATR